MTAAVGVGTRGARDGREMRSFLAVIVLIVVALGAGLLVRQSVEGAVQQAGEGGLNAQLPAGWIVLPAAGDRLLTAYDPLDPDLRYGVAAIDSTGGVAVTPEDAAARRIQDRSNLLEAFTVTSGGPGNPGSPSRPTKSATPSSTRRPAGRPPRSMRSSTTSPTARSSRRTESSPSSSRRHRRSWTRP